MGLSSSSSNSPTASVTSLHRRHNLRRTNNCTSRFGLRHRSFCFNVYYFYFLFVRSNTISRSTNKRALVSFHLFPSSDTNNFPNGQLMIRSKQANTAIDRTRKFLRVQAFTRLDYSYRFFFSSFRTCEYIQREKEIVRPGTRASPGPNCGKL